MTIQERIKDYYESSRKELLTKIQRRLLDPQCIEDVLQEAFTRALTFASSFKEDGNFNAWFGIILNNCVKDHRKEFLYNQAGVSHNNSEELDEENFLVDHKDLDIDWVAIEKTLTKIGMMIPSQREIVRLYFLYSYTPKEIKMLTEGYSMASINSVIYKAKKSLEVEELRK